MRLYRYLTDKGADLLFVRAAFTAYTGKEHWQVLLQARAIENTSYVIAPAQTGKQLLSLLNSQSCRDY